MTFFEKLYNRYKDYRKDLDSMVNEPYDWKDKGLMEFFKQELFETIETEDETEFLEFSYETWLELNETYKKESTNLMPQGLKIDTFVNTH